MFWWPHDLPDGADMGKQRVVLLGEAVSRHCIEVSCPRSLAQPADSLWVLIPRSTTIVETTFSFQFSESANSHSQTPTHRFRDLSAPVV